MAIQIDPIESHVVNCPSCANALLYVNAGLARPAGGKPWLSDGDDIGALYPALRQDQLTPSAFLPTLMVGTCDLCEKSYYVVLVSFMDASFDDVSTTLLDNDQPLSTAYFTCSSANGDDPEWILRESLTDDGLLHEHQLGPFQLTSTEGVLGAFGVSSCTRSAGSGQSTVWEYAAGLLARRWDDMRRLLGDRLIHAAVEA